MQPTHTHTHTHTQDDAFAATLSVSEVLCFYEALTPPPPADGALPGAAWAVASHARVGAVARVMGLEGACDTLVRIVAGSAARLTLGAGIQSHWRPRSRRRRTHAHVPHSSHAPARSHPSRRRSAARCPAA